MKRLLTLLALTSVSCMSGPGNELSGDQETVTPVAPQPDSLHFTIDGNSELPASARFAISMYYHDSLGYGHPFSIPSSGASLMLSSPAFFLQADEKQTPFLVYPGEKISILYSKNGTLRMKIKGDQMRSAELNFFPELISQTDNLSYAFRKMPHLKNWQTRDSVLLSENYIGAVCGKRMALLLQKEQEFSPGFLHIAANAIRSAAIYDSLVLFWNNRTLLGASATKQKVLSKLNAVNNLEFQPFIFNTKLTCSYAGALLSGNPNFSVADSSSFAEMYRIITKNLQGQRKDFLLTRLLMDAYNKAIPIAPEYFSYFNEDCKNEAYKTAMRDRFTGTTALTGNNKTGNHLRSGNGKTIKSLEDVVAERKGRLILIDFWASWCLPCRAEMPFTEKLKNRYKDAPISFLYISLDGNTEDWRKAAEQENLDQENSYLFLNNDDAPFVRQHALFSIPRYMLIGKDGTLLRDDAPRPSDPELIRMIDQLLP